MSLHKKFIYLAKQKRIITNQLLQLLPQIYESGEYKKYARTIEGYAYRFAHIPESTVRKALNLNKYLRDKPRLQNLVQEVGVHKVSAVATLVDEKNEEVLIEKLRSMSLSALVEFAKEVRGSEKIQKLTFNLSADQINLFNLVKKQIAPELSVEEIFEKMCLFFLEAKKETTVEVKASSRHIPVKQKKKINKKYHSLCAYPACNKKAEEIHHQVPYSIAKSHDKIVPLCKNHHQFMHNNLVMNSDKDPHFWKLQLQPTFSRVDLKYLKMRN